MLAAPISLEASASAPVAVLKLPVVLLERAVAAGGVVVAGGVVEERGDAAGGVVAAGGVGVERADAGGGVDVAGGVGLERAGAGGGVVVAGGVGLERADAGGGVLGADGVVAERAAADGGVEAARGVVEERGAAERSVDQARREVLQRARPACCVAVVVAFCRVRRPTPAQRDSQHQDESGDHKTSDSIHRILRTPGTPAKGQGIDGSREGWSPEDSRGASGVNWTFVEGQRAEFQGCYDGAGGPDVPFIPPMLATRLEDPRPLADPRYLAEPKLDGQRAQLHVHDHRTLHAYSRPGRELIRLPGLAWLREIRWPIASAVLERPGGGATDSGGGTPISIFWVHLGLTRLYRLPQDFLRELDRGPAWCRQLSCRA